MDRFWWCLGSLLVQKRSKRSFDQIWSRSDSRAQNHLDAGWKIEILAREFSFRSSEQNLTAIMYILASRFMGFTKQSRSSEHFGAQICEIIVHFFRCPFSQFFRFGGSKSIKTSWEQNLTAIMYMFASGFMGFTKYSRRSEHFGAQICHTMGSHFFQYWWILRFETAQIVGCETA